MATSIHRGEIVEKVMRRSGYSLTKLAAKLDISRNTLYNRFKDADLSYTFIMEVGKVIHYDFSVHFPEMQEILVLTNKDFPQYGEQQLATLWRLESRYARLLEKYNKLLEIVISVVDANELHDIRQEIEQLTKEKAPTKSQA
jgi:uncharacterized protein YdcH (DUF465 family)